VQGGGRSRVYFFWAFQEDRNHGMAPLAWFYFGIGRQPGLDGHELKDEFDTDGSIPEGATMVLNQEYAPVILEVMAKSDMKSFDHFRARVKACTTKMDGRVLTYRSVYGDLLTFDTSYQQTPMINGSPANDAREKAFESPFLNAEYNSGIVTIRKGTREKVLNFNKEGEK
jgi:hypothetical protein